MRQLKTWLLSSNLANRPQLSILLRSIELHSISSSSRTWQGSQSLTMRSKCYLPVRVSPTFWAAWALTATFRISFLSSVCTWALPDWRSVSKSWAVLRLLRHRALSKGPNTAVTFSNQRLENSRLPLVGRLRRSNHQVSWTTTWLPSWTTQLTKKLARVREGQINPQKSRKSAWRLLIAKVLKRPRIAIMISWRITSIKAASHLRNRYNRWWTRVALRHLRTWTQKAPSPRIVQSGEVSCLGRRS